MTYAADIAETYIAAWNETDAKARRAMIADTWTADATYVDPMAAVAGHDGLDALIAGVQERFPGFRFELIGQADGHGENVRFSWGLGPVGGEAARRRAPPRRLATSRRAARSFERNDPKRGRHVR